ncbi:MAG: DUF167 domain-containing protein [bacterium]
MSLFVDIKVIPSSGRQKFVFDKAGILKCYLKSVPEKGKANQELVKFLAKSLSLPMGFIEITSGLSSRKKRIKIELDLSYEDFLKKLELENK